MDVILRGSYLALLAWQPVWHALLPKPVGAESPLLAFVASLPLLLPLRGVLRLDPKGIAWASYVLILYLLVGVTEGWSNSQQRVPALVQTGLVCMFVFGVAYLNRRRTPEA